MSRLRELSPEEMSALEKRDPLASALTGANRAISGAFSSALHPIETSKALIQALRSPRQTLKAAKQQIQSDWAEDPVRTIAELTFPTPSPGGSVAGKLRKIIIPQNMATDAEKKVIRKAREEFEFANAQNKDFLEAAIFRDEPGYVMKAAADLAKKQDAYASAFEGWYPGIDGRFRKEFAPPEIDRDVLMDPSLSKHMPIGRPSPNKVPLHAILRDKDLATKIEERLVAEKKNWPTVVRTGSRPGGGFTDLGPGQSALIEVGGDIQSDVVNTFDHELQHLMQSLGRFGPRSLGEDAKNVPWREYLMNPGEVEARVAALRRPMSPTMQKTMSQPMQEAMALRFMEQSGRNVRPESLLDTVNEFNAYRGAPTSIPNSPEQLSVFLQNLRKNP